MAFDCVLFLFQMTVQTLSATWRMVSLGIGNIIHIIWEYYCSCASSCWCLFSVKGVPRSKSDEVDSRGRSMPVPTRSSSLKPPAKRSATPKMTFTLIFHTKAQYFSCLQLRILHTKIYKLRNL